MARSQFLRIELGQPIIESPKPGELGVEREAAVIADFAIVLVQTESSSLERVRDEIRLHVFLGYRFVFGVLRLPCENRAGERKRQKNYGKPERFPSSTLITTRFQPRGKTRWQMKPS